MQLPAGVQVFERGWLSSNNVLLCDAHSATLVDSGYASHAPQTLALVQHALGQRPLDTLVNTHLHSDHCGGNAALQARYAKLQTRIPPGLAEAVSAWREGDLSYQSTGQTCPPFTATGLLQPGRSERWADAEWEVHPAPGHDPHSVILFCPEHRLLISADALWQHGFGVVFPELLSGPSPEGSDPPSPSNPSGFDDVAASLDLIERLNPTTVIPGHGAVFTDVSAALQRARQKLQAFVRSPDKHARHGTKVLLKFKLQEFGRIAHSDFMAWARTVPYLQALHQRHGGTSPWHEWLQQVLAELAHSGAIRTDGEVIEDVLV